MKDNLFTQDYSKQFEFDSKVASVFDDMLTRSIPYYNTTLELSIDFIHYHIKDKAMPIIYDLGSSTGNFLLSLKQALQKESLLYGLDNSPAMIQRAMEKSKAYGYDIHFECQDFLKTDFLDCDAIVAHYTIQFIRPLYREKLIQKIANALYKKQGIFIMSEKMTTQDKKLDKEMIDRYYCFKKQQGYSINEITKKREALENVLIPYTLEENIQMLKNCGFKSVEVLFKWINFGTIIAKI
ncbi:carboxy-S-adenosyl-L-methionine synthase CmoA [Helicobacter anatolicus]|uniref:carboxy-S-adenosyl-L-methionine synthase CmoA n=1 Tax=Helicobacter anatolicus TaxID=2905874 RepID=UPI001E58656B|nr:carboxy-S-adenosyl-L-methionine synthase CmoA [Helicobacter anatolicus]MCE3039139.1 carboxy-S-adenosyl-L-methionine synthase CmoA [Helicobacter anatolicus]